MSIQRNYQRHGKPAAEHPPQHRGVRGQTGRHIIKKGIRHARRLFVVDKRSKSHSYKYIPGAYPVELHATKGWRNVPAWT
jgi:hypothetical protein